MSMLPPSDAIRFLLKGNVLSQNLTQPEEIDRVLMEMAGQDMKMGTPVTDGTQLNGIMQDSGCAEPVQVTGFSYGAVHDKAAHGLADP